MHNFRSLQEADVFIKANGKEKLESGDVALIGRLAAAEGKRSPVFYRDKKTGVRIEMSEGALNTVEGTPQEESKAKLKGTFDRLKADALRRGMSEADAERHAEIMITGEVGHPSLKHCVKQSSGSGVRNMGSQQNEPEESARSAQGDAEKLTESFMRIPGMTKEKAELMAQM